MTGTIRENRIGFPKSLGNPLPVKVECGISRWFCDRQTIFVKWKDTKVVCVISSYYPATGRETVERVKGKLVGGEIGERTSQHSTSYTGLQWLG